MNALKKSPENKQIHITSYLIGFSLSIVLTIAAYGLVLLHIQTNHQVISHTVLLTAIIGLGVVQMIIQLLFFLHLGNESRPRWNVVFFLSTIGIVLILVIGSIWIMNHLNYNMTPAEMNRSILKDEGIPK